MKKRMICILAVAGFLLTLTGCGASSAGGKTIYEIGEPGTWIDGSYTETAKGKKGDFEVTVIIQNGNITSVTIGNNQETPDRGGVAIAQLPDKIIEAQSFEVDAVSGATVTSDGIKDAVARCLEKASE